MTIPPHRHCAEPQATKQSSLSSLRGRKAADPDYAEARAIQPSLIFAAIFSLGLHGLIASFLIPSAPTRYASEAWRHSSIRRMVTVQVIWERNNDGLLHHAPTDEKSEKSSITTEKKASKLSKAPTQIKKMAYTPPLLLDSGENDEGMPKVGEENKSHSFKPESKTTTNRKTHHPLPEYPWICRKRRQ